MDLIKAVRVRPEKTEIYERLGALGDYKLMLFKETKKKYKVGWFPVKGGEPNGVLTTTEYKKSGIYEDLTEEDFLIEGLNLLSKMNKKTYEIVQDPWEYQPPLKRIYNSDPYYLNNGAKVFINWFIGDRFDAGDKRTWVAVVPSDIWSGDRGEELEIIPYQSYPDIRTMNNGLFKTVEIHAPVNELPPFGYEGDDTVLLIDYETNSFVKKPENDTNNSSVYELTYSGEMYNVDILKAVIERWKLEVPNYDLKPCAKQYQPCYELEYKSPLVKKDLPDTKEDNVVPVTETTPEVIKEKLSILLPSDLKLKVKQDIPSLRVYIGEIPPNATPPLEGFDAGDEFDDLSLLGEQYTESLFEGNEETVNEITDEPMPETYVEESERATQDNSPVGNANLSSLVFKSKNGLYYIKDPGNGLAGPRLKKILSDLESYLNDNGYKGATIKSNGVMRDLVASTYPSNPARAVASLHGAGLAIDVKFNIPGKIWNSISDNKNLASDSKLNKLIYTWVQSQGDLTWGGQWGGSKPGEGIVKGWGITEYHHFEIKAGNINKYWEPYKDNLYQIGFDYKKLGIKVGKGSELERFNKAILAGVGVNA